MMRVARNPLVINTSLSMRLRRLVVVIALSAFPAAAAANPLLDLLTAARHGDVAAGALRPLSRITLASSVRCDLTVA